MTVVRRKAICGKTMHLQKPEIWEVIKFEHVEVEIKLEVEQQKRGKSHPSVTVFTWDADN
jgi:hypothetical protein